MITKNRIIFFACVLLVLSVGLNLRSCSDIKSGKEALRTSNELGKYWRDKEGRSRAMHEIVVADRDYLLKINTALRDSLKKVGVNPRTVKEVITVTKFTEGKVILTRGMFSDHRTKFILKDSALSFSIRDSLAIITHDHKYGLFNLRKKYVAQAISFNPRTTLTGITAVEIKPEDHRINVGPYVGYGLTLTGGEIRPGWQIGVGIQIRF